MRSFVLCSVVAALLLAGCGGSTRPSTTTATDGGAKIVRVYFCNPSSMSCSTKPTPRQERLVGAHLRRDACTKTVTFTSKAAALREMKKKYPKLFGKGSPGFPSNPLPDSYTIVPTDPACAAGIAAAARAAHWPGVERVDVGKLRRTG